MKQLIAGLAVGAVVVGGIWFFSNADHTVAVVGDYKITDEIFYNKLQAAQGEAVLTKLIDDQVIKIQAEKLGFKATEEDINKEIDKLVEDKFGGDKSKLESALSESKMTMDDLKKEAKTSVLLRQIATKDVKITDDEIKDYYDKNKESMGEPEQVHARHILVKDEKQANDIYNQLQADPSKFEELAKQYSIDTSNKDQGGDLDYFGKGQMVKEFEDAAFAAKKGDITKPVHTEFGYHIIQVLDHKEAKVPTLEEKKDEIIETLKEQKMTPYQDLINELHAKTEIQINDKKYDTILNPPIPGDPTQGAAQ
ncbi:MAG TPA: peptidylprolyl isomerase [Bacilli bacterium]|nr:peptidylprolyl isomerase [Bacilli bacterium]